MAKHRKIKCKKRDKERDKEQESKEQECKSSNSLGWCVLFIILLILLLITISAFVIYGESCCLPLVMILFLLGFPVYIIYLISEACRN